MTELPGSTERCFRLLAPNIYDAIYRDWTADSVNAYVIYQEIPGQNIVPVEHCQRVSGSASTKDSVPLMVGKVRREVADELGSGFSMGLGNRNVVQANKAKRLGSNANVVPLVRGAEVEVREVWKIILLQDESIQ